MDGPIRWMGLRWVLICGLPWFAVVTQASANPVIEWNVLMLEAIRQSNTGPTLSTRNLAILHTAIFDAANSVDRVYQPYLFQFGLVGETSTAAATIGAGQEVLRTLYPGTSGRAQELLEAQLRLLPDDDATANGLSLGRTAAHRMLDARGDDGAATQIPYVPSAEPGQWRRTAPYFRPPLDPHWRHVERFCLDDPERFMVPPPPVMNSVAYGDDWEEVRQWGSLNSTRRSEYDSESALFWSDFSYTAMPPGHWHEITQGIVREQDLSLLESARLFALISLAQADAAIICWDGKYRYNLWRPETAIQRADEDGNESTTKDSSWQPWLVAPNFPEYPSGHSTFSHAAAAVLAEFFGRDAMEFDAWSDSLPGVVRHYGSFKACAEEVGLSRIHGGIHFQFANREGARSGRAIGQFIARNWMLPNTTLPLLAMERNSEGDWQVRLHGKVATSMQLQQTETFATWDEIQNSTGFPGGALYVLPRQELTGQKFYRIFQNE